MQAESHSMWAEDSVNNATLEINSARLPLILYSLNRPFVLIYHLCIGNAEKPNNVVVTSKKSIYTLLYPVVFYYPICYPILCCSYIFLILFLPDSCCINCWRLDFPEGVLPKGSIKSSLSHMFTQLNVIRQSQEQINEARMGDL